MFGLSKNDVLCGRGGLSNNHPGNRLFRRLVHVNKALYQQSLSPIHKQMVAVSIVEAIRTHGGRFIRKINGEWVEISTKDAAIKTSQALRETMDNSDSSSSSSSQSSNSLSRSKEMKVKSKNKDCEQYMECQPKIAETMPVGATTCQGDDMPPTKAHYSSSMVAPDDYESDQSQEEMFEGCDFEPLSLGHTMGTWVTPEFRAFLDEVTIDLMEVQ